MGSRPLRHTGGAAFVGWAVSVRSRSRGDPRSLLRQRLDVGPAKQQRAALASQSHHGGKARAVAIAGLGPAGDGAAIDPEKLARFGAADEVQVFHACDYADAQRFAPAQHRARTGEHEVLHNLLQYAQPRCMILCMTEMPNTSAVPTWDLADRLGKSLRTSGLSRQDMADYLAVHRNTITNWISGRITPSVQTVRLWALRCGVPYEWLTTGQAALTPPPTGGSTAP